MMTLGFSFFLAGIVIDREEGARMWGALDAGASGLLYLLILSAVSFMGLVVGAYVELAGFFAAALSGLLAVLIPLILLLLVRLRPGQATPSRARVTPNSGRADPDRGRADPDSGRADPDSGRVTPDSGRATPVRGCAVRDWGRAARDWGRAARDWGHVLGQQVLVGSGR